MKCYLQENDPPEDHDLLHYSCVCGKCYAALADLEREAHIQIERLKLRIKELEAENKRISRNRPAFFHGM